MLSFSPIQALSTRDWFTGLRLSEDLPTGALLGVLALVLTSFVLLVLETRAQQRRRGLLFLTGALGTLLLSLTILRPSKVHTEGQEVPGLGLVLVDASHRLELPAGQDELSRREQGREVIEILREMWSNARLEIREFGATLGDRRKNSMRKDPHVSDLLQALRQVSKGAGERPQKVVLLSDGRLTRPGPKSGADWRTSLEAAAGGIPIDVVYLSETTPHDRSIRSVGLTGSAIAHQPFILALEVGCEPMADCAEIEIRVSELLEGQVPVELVRGKARGLDGVAKLDLQVTLDRAGGRVIEVELLGGGDDEIPENDRRILPVLVKRDRLRMLHVAGRPTYDVRALRMFLKSDESIDLVSFFILRTMEDQVMARADEMALIPFPVNELFSEHLKSFDAVILQDINAREYQLDRHFLSLSDYVLKGGGLILVGGHAGFSSGGYAGTPIEELLPVELPTGGELISRKPFVPLYTSAGRAAPMLASLRSTIGEELPEMSGTNLLGSPRAGALVLWEHPTLRQRGESSGEPMPILALSEVGDGRTIAISVDSTHKLRFGESGARGGGRAYADLWGGLLGWLMRDPRYEGAQIALEGNCVAGKEQYLRVQSLSGGDAELEVTLARLGTKVTDARPLSRASDAKDGSRRYIVRSLGAGGYAARVRVGDAPPSRAVFACETGGEAWSDSRPDPQRLSDISETTGGQAVAVGEVSKLLAPKSTFVAAHSRSRPILPSWLWAAVAALSLSVHWIVRRTVGIA